MADQTAPIRIILRDDVMKAAHLTTDEFNPDIKILPHTEGKYPVISLEGAGIGGVVEEDARFMFWMKAAKYISPANGTKKALREGGKRFSSGK